MTGFNPFALGGEGFLWVFAALLVAAVALRFAIPRWLKPEGSWGSVSDAESLALLAGGRRRFNEAVVTDLLANRALQLQSDGQLKVTDRNSSGSGAGRKLLSASYPFHWKDVRESLAGEAEVLEAKLERKGLLMSDSDALSMRFWQSGPLILLLIFGALRCWIEETTDQPVGFLPVLMFFTLVITAFSLPRVDRTTRGGVKALHSVLIGADRLRRAPTNAEMGLAVALFGTKVLAGTPFADFHALRAKSSSGCGGGCGGDGGGSTGCSGCGGD